MKIKKRGKRTRLRGSRTFGWGFRQKHKSGKGNKGGVGMSGTGKRGDQKRQFARIVAMEAGFKTYFGKQGYTSGGTARKPNKVINLSDIAKNFSIDKEIKLAKYKILGEGNGFKGTILAQSASKSAIEKMEKAGGKIIVSKKEYVKNEKKVAGKEEKKKDLENPQAKKKEKKKTEVKKEEKAKK